MFQFHFNISAQEVYHHNIQIKYLIILHKIYLNLNKLLNYLNKIGLFNNLLNFLLIYKSFQFLIIL